MPIPEYPNLLVPVLKLFDQGVTSINKCMPAIKEQFDISDEEARELIPSGKATLLFSRIHWARICLSRAGLLEFTLAKTHAVTELGRKLLAAIRPPD